MDSPSKATEQGILAGNSVICEADEHHMKHSCCDSEDSEQAEQMFVGDVLWVKKGLKHELEG